MIKCLGIKIDIFKDKTYFKKSIYKLISAVKMNIWKMMLSKSALVIMNNSETRQRQLNAQQTALNGN